MAVTRRCGTCAASLPTSARFCAACGTAVPSASAAGAPSEPPAAAADVPGWGERIITAVRTASPYQLMGIFGSLALGMIDFQLHAGIGGLLVAAGGIALTLFAGVIVDRLDLPPAATSIVVTIPLSLYFVIRGSGTLDTGPQMLVMAIMIGFPLAFHRLAPQLDPMLAGFFAARDRMLPTPVRPIVVLAVSVLVTFGLVHGELADVKTIWGGTASKVGTPSGSETVLIVVLNLVVGFVLLHEPQDAPVQPAEADR